MTGFQAMTGRMCNRVQLVTSTHLAARRNCPRLTTSAKAAQSLQISLRQPWAIAAHCGAAARQISFPYQRQSSVGSQEITGALPGAFSFHRRQGGPSERQPSSTVRSTALAEPPALEQRSKGNSPAVTPPEDAVTRILEPEQLTDFLDANKQQLVVLMCKAHSCRPCKMFMRKYARIAQQYKDRGVHFLEIFGDDTKETRQLMMAMEVRVTPNFRLYREGRLVHSLTGINETNLRNAVEEH